MFYTNTPFIITAQNPDIPAEVKILDAWAVRNGEAVKLSRALWEIIDYQKISSSVEWTAPSAGVYRVIWAGHGGNGGGATSVYRGSSGANACASSGGGGGGAGQIKKIDLYLTEGLILTIDPTQSDGTQLLLEDVLVGTAAHGANGQNGYSTSSDTSSVGYTYARKGGAGYPDGGASHDTYNSTASYTGASGQGVYYQALGGTGYIWSGTARGAAGGLIQFNPYTEVIPLDAGASGAGGGAACHKDSSSDTRTGAVGGGGGSGIESGTDAQYLTPSSGGGVGVGGKGGFQILRMIAGKN